MIYSISSTREIAAQHDVEVATPTRARRRTKTRCNVDVATFSKGVAVAAAVVRAALCCLQLHAVRLPVWMRKLQRSASNARFVARENMLYLQVPLQRSA